MFFCIGEHSNYLTKVHDNLYLDHGWTNIGNVWYKGYSTECNLKDNIDKIINGYSPKGIYCVIQFDKNYNIFHSPYRGFPIYKKENVCTNVYEVDIPVEYIKGTSTSLTEKSLDEVIKSVLGILSRNIKNYIEYNSAEINIWCTGGLDTTSIIAVCEKEKIPYNIYVAKPKRSISSLREFEGSLNQYDSDLFTHLKNNHWGYKILSLFKEPIQLTTGFYGDEYVGRGPGQINQIANSMGTVADKVVNSTHYMYKYLLRQKNFYLNDIDEKNAKQNIYHLLINDYQIWHFDYIQTFCPYYDIDIAVECLSLKSNVLLECSLDGTIQKEIIKLCNPDILKLLDVYKNTGDSRVNFYKNISQVPLSSCKEIIWV